MWRTEREEAGGGGVREEGGSVYAESFSRNSVGWFATSIRSGGDAPCIATNSVRAEGCGLCHFWGRDRPGPRIGPTPPAFEREDSPVVWPAPTRSVKIRQRTRFWPDNEYITSARRGWRVGAKNNYALSTRAAADNLSHRS